MAGHQAVYRKIAGKIGAVAAKAYLYGDASGSYVIRSIVERKNADSVMSSATTEQRNRQADYMKSQLSKVMKKKNKTLVDIEYIATFTSELKAIGL